MKNHPTADFKRITFDVPTEHHRALKATAARRGFSVKNLILMSLKSSHLIPGNPDDNSPNAQ